jgi:hypothetical protein
MQSIVTAGLPSELGARRKVYSRPDDVSRRLSELDLRQDVLIEAVRQGLLARLECTKNHPRTTAGFNAWSDTVCRLRDLLVPLGWITSNAANQGLVVNERLSLILNVAGGNECTGVADLIPSTRSRKGPSMADAVKANSQKWLFDEMEPKISASGRGSWLLLAYWNSGKQHVQLELSHPVKWSEDERPVDWSERILLPNISHNDPLPATKPSSEGGAKTPEITVEIKRRA